MGVPRLDARYTTDVLFDHEIDAPPGELLLSTFYHRDDSQILPRLSTPHYRRWQMFTCLPLVYGSTYSSGLTLYWRRDALSGMTSYAPGERPVTIGRCTGLARHVPLAQGEHFTSLWLRRSGRHAHHTPSLLTVGRTIPRVPTRCAAFTNAEV